MNNPTMTASLSAGRRQQTIIGAVLAAQVVAVLALLPGRQAPPTAPAPVVAAAPAPAVAAKPAAAHKSRGKKAARREAADERRPAAGAGKPAASPVAAAAQPERTPPAKADGASAAPPTAEAAATHAEGMDVVEGIWVGVRTCPDSPDLHIAVKIAAGKAWVYSHSGSAAAPLSPGCLSATWSYNAGRTYLQVLPQAWLWRTAQTDALRLEGFVSGRQIDGQIADLPGCRAFTLHKAAANAFPAECR